MATPTKYPAVVDVPAFLAEKAKGELHEGSVKRRELREKDVSIKVHYCGICHTDLHMLHNDWGRSTFPMVPGHEITGVVEEVGSKVKKFKVGQRVGVGCIVNSCQNCDRCGKHVEQFCEDGMTMAYGYPDKISGGVTYGGYSERIVVEDHYVISIPDSLELAAAAPLLCAGITVYSPLVTANVGKGSKVGIVGIGGLGHLGIKLAKALGAEVIAFTSKADKKDELLVLGATDVVVTSNPEDFKRVTGQLNLIIDTVSADHDSAPYLATLKFGANYVVVGAPPGGFKFPAVPLIFQQVHVSGSGIGGIKLTQDMINLCADKNVLATIETLPLKEVNTALARLEKGDVRYRFVLDVLHHEFTQKK